MWKLAPAAMAASALHAAVWLGVSGWHTPATPAPNARPQPVTVRWVQAPRPQPTTPTIAAQAAAPDQITPPDATTQTVATEQPLAPAPPAPGTSTGNDPTDDPWWPRPQLTRPPVPRTLVNIDFPAGEPSPGRHRAVLALYIDAEGRVQRVDTSDADLPGPYIEAARNAFLTAQFEPGEIQGCAVKSMIRIEVQFDQAAPTVTAEPTRLTRTFAGMP